MHQPMNLIDIKQMPLREDYTEGYIGKWEIKILAQPLLLGWPDYSAIFISEQAE